MKIPENLTILNKYFDQLYIVGGYVRNSLLYGGYSGTDVDICGPYTPDEVTAKLENTPVKVTPVNPRIGTLLLRFGEEEYEYTTFREDSYPIGGEHTPQDVRFVKDILVDAKRRDFTINAIYYNLKTGEIIDPLGGQKDLENGILRTTDTPEKVFGEDGLRILRLARFVAELGFQPEENTLTAAKKLVANLDDITAERKRMEIDRILSAPEKYCVKDGIKKGLNLITALDGWKYLIPAFVGEKNDAREKGIEACNRADKSVRLPALLHCVATALKPQATAKESGELARVILGHDVGLKYKDSVRSEAIRLISACDFDETGNVSEGEIRLFVQQNYVYMDKLLLLLFAIKGEKDEVVKKILHIFGDMKDHDVPSKLSDLHIRGYDVIRMGFAPNRIGEVLEKILVESALRNKRFTLEEELAIAESLK